MKTGKGLFYATSIHRQQLSKKLQGADRMTLPFRPTPDNPMIISISELQSFQRCRQQWHWSKRVGLQSTKIGMPRVNGILVHSGKESFYRLPRKKRTLQRMQRVAGKAFDKVTEVPVEKKDRDLAHAMLLGYVEWVNGDHDFSDRAIGKRQVFPEWEFVLPLVADRSILIRGKIDELFEPTIYKGVLAMDETKTKNGISFDMMDLDAQLTTYLWAMWKAPQIPDWPLPEPLRKRYKRYIAWRTVLRRQMPGPRVKAPLFGRESIERDPAELELWELDTRRAITDMLDAAIYPSKRESCRYECDYYELCLVRASKEDMKAIIEEKYTIQTRKEKKK